MPKPAGRTNAQLTERTRRLLLDATIESLAEAGYSKTSTAAIARRAGVSRGALVHHFPTKASMVGAAVDHLFTRNAEEFRERFRALPGDERTFEQATDLLWEMLAGDTFRAGLELIVAGGSDPQLGSVVHEAVSRFQGDVARIFIELFPATRDGYGISSSGVVFAFAVVLGAAVYRQVGLDDLAEESIGVLRVLAQVAMPGLVGFASIAPVSSAVPIPSGAPAGRDPSVPVASVAAVASEAPTRAPSID